MFNPFHHVWFHIFQSVAAPYYPMIHAEAAHAFWWGATIDKNNHALVAKAGFPSN